MLRWRVLTFLLALLVMPQAMADSMAKYASVAGHIPAARMKANPKSQAWARSATSVLEMTHETLAQTIIAMQQAMVSTHQPPLFCVPEPQKLDTALIADILQRSAKEMTPSQAKRTISEVVVGWLQTHYPCNKKRS